MFSKTHENHEYKYANTVYIWTPGELNDNEKNFTIIFLHNKWEQLNRLWSHDLMYSEFLWYFILKHQFKSVHMRIVYCIEVYYKTIVGIELLLLFALYETCTIHHEQGLSEFRKKYIIYRREEKKIYIIIMCGRHILQWLLYREYYTACNNIIIKWPGEWMFCVPPGLC